MGKPYIDIQGTAIVKDIMRPEEKYAVIRFLKRGWTQDSYFRLEGEIFSSKGVVAYRFHGKWSESVTL